MKVGSIVYATYQGLGILAKSFFDAGVVTHPLVLGHRSRPNHGDKWYPGCPVISNKSLAANSTQLFRHCESVDVMLFFETPFYWPLIEHCRKVGTKTVLMPMYECLPPKSRLPYQPDRFICPSLLDLNYFPDDNSVFIPVPASPEVRWRPRHKVGHFIHNAGHGGLKGRNGTRELVDAMPLVKSPIRLTIRSQTRLDYSCSDDRVEIDYTHHHYDELFSEGDTFIFPESFNGLSLPLQEAYSAGYCVMATDRYPMNTWLPREPLIPVEKYRRDTVGGPCVEFDRAVIEPQLIAATIDTWYGRDISHLSSSGRDWAAEHSWEKLKPVYLEELRR